MSTDILLIPGPIVISKRVQDSLGTPSVAHTCPEFVATFSDTLKNTRRLFKAGDSAQPVVLAGSGTLGWDITASNLICPEEKALVLSTGFFSDSFADCLTAYGAKVRKLNAPLGDVVPLDEVRSALKKDAYKLITITHVDTSTAVLSDVKSICEVVKEISPETLIVVDAVCSAGCETLDFDTWGIDCALTASQKALGAPPGLSISMLSQRATRVALQKEEHHTFFTSLKKWIPIMQNYEKRQASYFATPAVQLVNALKESTGEILEYGLDKRIEKHREVSEWFKSHLTRAMGLKLVSANDAVSAHGLTAVYVKDPPAAISALKARGIVIAGGIHKDIKGEYIRIGHMGESACNDSLKHLQKCIDALKQAAL